MPVTDASSGSRRKASLSSLLARAAWADNREVLDMPKRAYECGSCNEVHGLHHEAERCCQPEINDVWLCDVCEDSHDDKEDAEKCCIGKVKARGIEAVRCPSCYRDQELIQHAIEIEVAGHCSECNPHYSIDDTFKIGDLVDQQIAENLERSL